MTITITCITWPWQLSKKFVASIGDVIHHVISCNPSCNYMTFLFYYMPQYITDYMSLHLALHALHIQLQSDYNIHYIIYYTNHYMELYMQFTCISHRITWKTSKTLHVVLHDTLYGYYTSNYIVLHILTFVLHDNYMTHTFAITR